MSFSPALPSIAQALLAPGRGLLAADESFPTIGKRFQALGIPSTAENRLAYRTMLFQTPGLGRFISGVILFDETIRQKIAGQTVPEFLHQRGLVPGIKVDMGTMALPGAEGEKITLGLEGLPNRLAEYRQLGARFTKWRAVITLGNGLPTATCLDANAEALARFASLSQQAGLVPIVEPEVLMDGGHSLARCAEVTTTTLQRVFASLAGHHVALEGLVLKTGMVLPGKDCPQQAGLAEIAEATLRCLHHAVPATVPGLVFLSGGQHDVEATERLNAICRAGDSPWKVTFSYGRALQDAAMKTWRGSPANVPIAQAALHHRARCNSLAVLGKYSATDENLTA